MTHMQNPPTLDWPHVVAALPRWAGFKWVDGIQNLATARQHNPDCFLWLRHWYDHGQQFIDSTNWVDHVEQARRFFAAFVDGTFDQYAHTIDAIEGWNEFNAQSHTPHEVAIRVAGVEARAWVWATEYRTQPRYEHLRLIIGNVAVGNDLPLGYARIADQYDCILGYHAYWPVRDGEILADEWDHYSGRWAVMDARFVASGYRCDWIFTEAGEVGYDQNANGDVFLRAFDGWKHPTVYNADLDALLDGVRYWMRLATDTPAWREGRVVGGFGAVFTSSSDANNWPSFDKQTPVLVRIAGVFHEFDEPVPPPPPPPPPDRRVGDARVPYSRDYWRVNSGATLEQWLSVCREAYETRSTVGFSADDAGIGVGLASKRVREYGGEYDEQVIEDWYAAEYGVASVTHHGWPAPVGPVWEAWPVTSTRINQAFGARPDVYAAYGLPGHEGVDIYAIEGEPVSAVLPGRVVLVGDDVKPAAAGGHNYGTRVYVETVIGGDVYTVKYTHLKAGSRMVDVGEWIWDGETIGAAGDTGNTTGVHLHLTMTKRGATAAGETAYPHDIIDPTPWMQTARSYRG